MPRGKKRDRGAASPQKGTVDWWEDITRLFSAHYKPLQLAARAEQHAFLRNHLLQDPNGLVVYVYGTPGTGKTALVTNLLTGQDKYLHLTCTSFHSTKSLLSYLCKWVDGLEEGSSPWRKSFTLQQAYDHFVGNVISPPPGKVVPLHYLVLDEVDFLLRGKNTPRELKKAGDTFKLGPRTPISSVIREFVQASERSGSRLKMICISNKADLSSDVRLERQCCFPPYQNNEMKEILNKRLCEGGVDDPDTILSEKARDYLVKKAMNKGSGDCRLLLEFVRRLVSEERITPAKLEVEASKDSPPPAVEPLSMGAVARSLPASNPVLKWLQSLGPSEHVLVTAAVILRERTRQKQAASGASPPAPITLGGLAQAFHLVSERYLGGWKTVDARDEGKLLQDPRDIVAVVNRVNMTHSLLHVSDPPKRPRSKAPVRLQDRVVSVSDLIEVDALKAAFTALHNRHDDGVSILLARSLDEQIPSREPG